MNENQVVENQAVTPTAPVSESEAPTPVAEEVAKTFTQDQLNDIIKERLNRSHDNTLKHYGVESYEELDEIVKHSREWKDQFDKLTLANNGLLKENVFLKNNIDTERYDDIDVYFKGAGLEFSADTFADVLAKHPEWVKQQPKPITITSLGKEADDKHVETEEEKMKRIFG